MEKLQQIQTKRGIKERKRRKRWLWFKNRGLTDLYTNRFKTSKPVVAPTIKLVWWRKTIFNIQKFFYNLFLK